MKAPGCLSASCIVLCNTSCGDDAACTAQPIDPAAAPVNAVHAVVGQSFTISLAADAVHGEHWELATAPDTAMMELTARDYHGAGAGSDTCAGAEGFTFHAKAEGKAALMFNLYRSTPSA